MNVCDLIIKYTDDPELLFKYFDACLKVRELNEESKSIQRT